MSHIGEALLARHVRGDGLEGHVPRVGVPRALAAHGPRRDPLEARVVIMVVVVVQVIVVLVVVGERALRRVGEQRVVVVVAAKVVAARATVAAAVADGRVVAAVVQHADGAVLANAIRDLARVDPERQLVGQQLAQTSFLEAAGAASLGQDRVHLVVDSDAAVARALRRLLGKPVVLVVVPQQVL